VCVVIDACCLVKVFDPENREHGQFAPIWEWISRGRGRMIYGGTKYLAELSRVRKVLPIVNELQRKGRVKVMSGAGVDTVAAKIKQKVGDGTFDDEHLVAIVIVSRCRVVCTDDESAMPYLKRPKLFADYGMKRPKIYNRSTHEHLCCDENLIHI
jgi:hypothetical protein